MRTLDGTLITFDVPGAGTGPFHGTYALSIHPAETITGFYVDASGLASMPNPAGAIVERFLDASNAYHGFLLEGE